MNVGYVDNKIFFPMVSMTTPKGIGRALGEQGVDTRAICTLKSNAEPAALPMDELVSPIKVDLRSKISQETHADGK